MIATLTENPGVPICLDLTHTHEEPAEFFIWFRMEAGTPENPVFRIWRKDGSSFLLDYRKRLCGAHPTDFSCPCHRQMGTNMDLAKKLGLDGIVAQSMKFIGPEHHGLNSYMVSLSRLFVDLNPEAGVAFTLPAFPPATRDTDRYAGTAR